MHPRDLNPVFAAFMLFALAGGGAPPAAAEEPYREWPREYSYSDGSQLILYQPQVESWENYARIEARAAIAFAQKGSEKPTVGTFLFQAATETNLETRLVNIHDFEILATYFPSLDGEGSRLLRERLEILFPEESVVISLDRVLANLERNQSEARPVEVRQDPPKIFTSLEPAILVLLDGKPLMSPIEDSDLQFAVNTNWDLFLYPRASTYYLRHDDAWLMAPGLGGPWSPAGKLPKKDPNWTEVRESLPGRNLKPEEVPVVFFSELPAELIVIDGKPNLSLITGTRLLWVTNTESDLFLSNADSQFYYLVSGRWFRAPNLDGDWSFATDDLPGDFFRIPPQHPRAAVLASVPGTPQANEAVLLSQIPQKAKVERDKVTATVVYQGEPEFKPIEGTSMYYAANTASDVIRIGDLYYLCFQAVWFVSTSPTGPWVVTDSVPSEIYTIPPSAPVYHTTYVRVYDATPTYVVYGYTSGYWGVYYSSGCVVYGTGWYYPPYVYWGPYYPIYYPYHYSYGVAAFYNPYTGTYGRGATVYGPYGGIGRGAAYNPSTGTYARGAVAWGPYEARGWAEAYNPRTGTYAQTRQGANAYSHWGTTGVSRGDDWLRTGHYADSRGTVGGFRTSEGGAGVGYRGEEGSGFIARGQENNLYAGKDGNVYRRTEDGWQKHDGDDWQQVERPADGERPSVDRSRSGEASTADHDRGTTDRGGSGRDRSRDTMGQLDRDARSRAEGARRSNDYRSWRSSGGAGRGRGGGSRSRPRRR